MGDDGERRADAAERGVGTMDTTGQGEPSEPGLPFDPYAPPAKGAAPDTRPKGAGWAPGGLPAGWADSAGDNQPRPGTPGGHHEPEQRAAGPNTPLRPTGGPSGQPPRPAGAPSPVDPRGQRALGFALLGLVSAYMVPKIGDWMGVTGVPLLMYEIGGSALGLALDVIAITLGIRYTRQATSTGKRAPGALGGAVLGSLAALTAAYVLAQYGQYFPQLRDYYSCMSGANTQVATDACQSTFDKAMRHRTSLDSPAGFNPSALFSLTR